MALFDEKVRKQLTEVLSQMKDEVKIVFFSQEIECITCRDARSFVEEISSLNGKIKLEKHNLLADKDKAELYNVDKVPAIVILNKDGEDTGIRFYGIPGGYEISSFLSALLVVSGRKEAIPQSISDRIAKIDKDINIQVFVTLGCPYCPNAVEIAHRIALENTKVRAAMIESNSFTDLAVKYHVTSVPKIVINDSYELVGTQPITAFLDMIEKI